MVRKIICRFGFGFFPVGVACLTAHEGVPGWDAHLRLDVGLFEDGGLVGKGLETKNGRKNVKSARYRPILSANRKPAPRTCCMPAQIQLKTVKMVKIGPESAVPAGSGCALRSVRRASSESGGRQPGCRARSWPPAGSAWAARSAAGSAAQPRIGSDQTRWSQAA